MYPGADPGFQVREGGGHLKKLRRAEGGAKMFGVFRVKNHDFTQKIIFFPILGGHAPGASPWIRPWYRQRKKIVFCTSLVYG